MLKRKLRCLYRLKSSKSAINVLMICGLLTLFIQIFIFTIIVYTSDSEFRWPWLGSDSYFSDPLDDLDVVKEVFNDFGLPLTIVDEQFLLQSTLDKSKKLSSVQCEVCYFLKHRTLQFAVDKTIRNEILDTFRNLKFYIIEFKNNNPKVVSTDLKPGITIAYILKRYSSLFLLVLHRREDNVWWFGDINSDRKFKEKLSVAGVPFSSINHIPAVKHEGLLNKFETAEQELTGTHLDFLFPKNVTKFLLDSYTSKYKECNWERARKFEKVHGRSQSAIAQKFRHRAWKLLAKVKAVFESLGVEFWLSSGTLLGYVRECGVISYSKDVDIGVSADSYSELLHPAMSTHGFHLLIRLGKPEDSFELSFTDQSGIKLDIFFFYKNPDGSVWNGGTQVKSGKKFKYSFSPFDLCWTLFQGLKVRVPCNTEKYIEANYGPNWFTPVMEWDWKTSPFNVVPNGQWPEEERQQVIQVFQ